jgi:hypothetical protein
MGWAGRRNVAKDFVRRGTWTGAAARFVPPPANDPALGAAILVQTAKAGSNLAAIRG